MGRKKRSKLDILRNKAWAHAAIKESNSSNRNQLATYLDTKMHERSEYKRAASCNKHVYSCAEGSRSPSLGMLRELRQAEIIYELGPCGLPLWKSIEGKCEHFNRMKMINDDEYFLEFHETETAKYNRFNLACRALNDAAIIDSSTLISHNLQNYVIGRAVECSILIEEYLKEIGVKLDDLFEITPYSDLAHQTIAELKQNGLYYEIAHRVISPGERNIITDPNLTSHHHPDINNKEWATSKDPII